MENPYRNGILNIVDNLLYELKVGEVESKIIRIRLKMALQQSTESQAEYYLLKIKNLIEGVICLAETRKKL